jgi:hypothetical protein
MSWGRVGAVIEAVIGFLPKIAARRLMYSSMLMPTGLRPRFPSDGDVDGAKGALTATIELSSKGIRCLLFLAP